MNATNRVKVKPGQCVLIVLKKDQPTGKTTDSILTPGVFICECDWGQIINISKGGFAFRFLEKCTIR